MMDPIEASAAAPKPWEASASLAWVILALAAGQAAAAAVLIPRMGGIAPADLAALRFDGPVIALATLVANPVQVAVLVWAVRRRGWRASDYLALRPFGRRELLIGVAACALLLASIAAFAWTAGLDLVTPFQIEAYSSARTPLWLVLLFLGVAIAGPLGEEITFRGFLFRGWVRPGRNPALAILAISVLWAAQHIQYDWFGLLQVFLFGLLLGWIRWRSGSTWLAFVLHALLNVEAAVETAVRVG